MKKVKNGDAVRLLPSMVSLERMAMTGFSRNIRTFMIYFDFDNLLIGGVRLFFPTGIYR